MRRHPTAVLDHAWDRQRRIGVQAKGISLAALEVEEARARDHRGIVRGETWHRRVHRDARRLETIAHRLRQRTVARDAATKHDALRSYAFTARAGFPTSDPISAS